MHTPKVVSSGRRDSSIRTVSFGPSTRKLPVPADKMCIRDRRKTKVNQGILYSSGLIAGEGLVGILLAVFAIIPVGADTLGDAINISKIINLGNIGGLVFFACLVATLVAFINKKEKKTK